MADLAVAGSKGRHIIVDLEGLERSKCIDPGIWEKAFISISVLMNVRIIAQHSHVFEAPFAPGLTAFFLLDASHLSVHTFADEGKAAVDLFSCTNFEDAKIVNQLLASLAIDQESIWFQMTIQRFGSRDAQRTEGKLHATGVR